MTVLSMSTLTWLDSSEHERRSVLELVSALNEPGTLDELGIGTIRDTIADTLFPGTSTIQTRARYFLFIPWILQMVEDGSPRGAEARARRFQMQLRDALISAHGPNEPGVIGVAAGEALQRWPLDIYWLGLARWGIRRHPGSISSYFASLGRPSPWRLLGRALDEPVEGRRDEAADSIPGNWAPIHPPPDGFPEVASFTLSSDEARFLRERVVLAARSLEEAELEETGTQTPEEELDNAVLAEMEKRKHLPNVSTFAFTATPKPKTLELFGDKQPDGSFAPFHLYSMRQAIEEGFIRDVLESYTTYKVYWRLIKKIEEDPRYDKSKADYPLRSFVDLHPHAIEQKVRVMVDHFVGNAQSEIGSRAKAMIVTRSRLHAVRHRLVVDRYLEELGNPFKALVAFSGTVQDGGRSYTESGMNIIPEVQTAKAFELPEYRFLIVANKFQTGFDQPMLHTMYVDKKLGGVNAVQTLSRLNRTHPEKQSTMVLDFANESDEIKASFEPYYETTILSEATDPNLLYEKQGRLGEFPVFTGADVEDFSAIYFGANSSQDQLYAALAPVVERFNELDEDEQHDFRGELSDYVRLYSFLAQVLPFSDVELEKLYAFARHLRRLLSHTGEELPREIQQNIDMESYRIQQTGSGNVSLDRKGKAGALDPVATKDVRESTPEELEALSRIIVELNERFGIELGPEHRITLGRMMERLEEDAALDAAAKVNTPENVRITFDHKVEEVIQEIVDLNFDLYKRITDDPSFGEVIKDHLFDQYLHTHRYSSTESSQ